jgi:predicted dehydrogenase
MSQTRVAVIGHGHLGKWHSDKVVACENADLAYIVEPVEENQKLAAKKHPNVKIVSSIEECIDDIDAGVIVTPTIYHYEITKKLLESEKHIFCEKPLCSTYSQVEKLRGKLSPDRVFQVGHSERFHELWNRRELFTPYLDGCHAEINRYAPFKGRATDVDVVQDLMIHDIDLLYYLFGEYPTRVLSVGHKIRTENWDSVVSMFHFSGGKTATINVGRNHCVEKREISLVNNHGACHIDLMNEVVTCSTDEGIDLHSYEFERRDHLLIEHQHFYDSILSNKCAVVNFDEGALAVKIVNAVQVSLEAENRGNFFSI